MIFPLTFNFDITNSLIYNKRSDNKTTISIKQLKEGMFDQNVTRGIENDEDENCRILWKRYRFP